MKKSLLVFCFLFVSITTVENQELLRLVISPGLAQLQCNPMCVGMLGHVEIKNLAPAVIDHKEAVQHSERQRGDGEKVHRPQRPHDDCEERPATAELDRDSWTHV